MDRVPVNSMDETKHAFLQGLRQILPALRNQTDGRIEQRIGKEKMQDAIDDTAGFIESGVQSTLTRNERIALTCQVLACLTSYMEQLEIPVTINTVVQQLGSLPHAVNQSFPGYAASRLLRYIILPPRVA